MNDSELLAKYARDGSQEAFTELVRRNTDMVYSSCLRRLGNAFMAEEATQAVFIALSRKARSIKSPGTLIRWLFTAAKFASTKMLRSEARRKKHEKEAAKLRSVEPEKKRSWEEVAPFLDDALLQLGSGERYAVVQRFFGNKSHAEVGEGLGVSEEAARKRVSYALEKLRRIFSKKGVILSAAILGTLLGEKAVMAAPAGLAAASSSLAFGGATAGSTGLIAEGVVKMMMWAKIKLIGACVAAAVVGGIGTPVAINAIAQEKRIDEKAKKENKKELTVDFNHEKAEQMYEEFNKFCIKHFGAEKEPLIYEKFGKDLKIMDDGSWQHISENSACIAWETNLPAKSYIEYGETKKYGKKTTEEERHFYLHIHYLKNLEAGKTYYYRFVSVDERGNKLVADDATVTPKKIDGAIYIPGDMGKPPYNLDKKGATYVLTGDITADGTAVNIVAGGVTLDLNGHTIIYQNVPGARIDPPKKDEFHGKGLVGAPGVRIYGKGSRGGTRLYNGFIVQGKGGNHAFGKTKGYNMGYSCSPPVFGVGAEECAGVTISYYGPHLDGFALGPREMHHNVCIDKGFKIVNRHQGTSAFLGKNRHHNLVKRARLKGMPAGYGREIKNNEIYVDSWASNGKGISVYNSPVKGEVIIQNNRIFGTGYILYGITTSNMWARNKNPTKVKVHSNLVHLVGMKPTKRFAEVGTASWVAGVRATAGSRLDYYDNLFSISLTAAGRSRAWGVWIPTNRPVANAVFRKNIFKVMGGPEKGYAGGIMIGGCGTKTGTGDDGKIVGGPVIFRDNTIISDHINIAQGKWKSGGKKLLRPPLAIGNAAVFYNNKIVRVGDRPDYKTIHFGQRSNLVASYKFYNSVFEGGAGYGKAAFLPRKEMKNPTWPNKGEVKREFSVGWTLTVKTAPGAKVTIKDKAGAEVFSGVSDADGKAEVQLLQYTLKSVGNESETKKIFHTPHKVQTEKDGKTTEKEVITDKRQEIEVEL